MNAIAIILLLKDAKVKKCSRLNVKEKLSFKNNNYGDNKKIEW